MILAFTSLQVGIASVFLIAFAILVAVQMVRGGPGE